MYMYMYKSILLLVLFGINKKYIYMYKGILLLVLFGINKKYTFLLVSQHY